MLIDRNDSVAHEIADQVITFLQSVGSDARYVRNKPFELFDGDVLVHTHPTRMDMPLRVPLSSPWTWEYAHGTSV